MADGRVTIDVDVNGQKLKGVNADLDQLSGKGNKAGMSIKNLAISMGLVKIASAAFNVLKNSIGGAVDRFDTMQKFPKVLKALGYSAEDSEKSMKKLSDGIDGLPTTLQDVVAQTQQMTAITGDLNKSTDTVLALNNAFLASGASTEDASRGMQQFNQMLSTGTVDLESWKTLQETMPLALQKTAEAMGFTGKTAQRDLYAALQSGEVTFDQFNDSIIKLGTGTGDLAKLAKENSLGIKTSFQNLGNAVTKGLANVLAKIDEVVQKLTGSSIAEHIDSLKGIINSMFDNISAGMDKVIPWIQMFMDKWGALKEATQPAIDVLKDAFQSLSDKILEILPSIQDVSDAIDKFISFIQENGPVIIPIITGIATALLVFGLVTSIITLATNAIALFGTVLAFVTSPIGLVVIAIGLLVAAGVALYMHWGEVKAWAVEKWNSIKDTISGAIENAKNAVSEKTQAMKSAISSKWEEIKANTSNTWESVKSTISDAIDGAKTNVSNAIDKIKGFFKSIGDIDLFEVGRNVIQGLVNGIDSMVGAVRDKIEEVAGNIKDKITGALGIHSPSRWMRDNVGKYIPQGIAVGIEADSKTAMKAMSNITTDLMGEITPELALGASRIGMASVGSSIINNSSHTETSLNSYTVEVPVVLDGKEVARIIEPFSERLANRKNMKQTRLGGSR